MAHTWVWCCPGALTPLQVGAGGGLGSVGLALATAVLQLAALEHCWGDASPCGKAEAVCWAPSRPSCCGLCGGHHRQAEPRWVPWAAALRPAAAAAVRESPQTLEKGESRGNRSGKREELGARAVGSSSRESSSVEGARLSPVARQRLAGRVRRGADPQARPRSAIDCSAFPINYSLIMENRLAPWLWLLKPRRCSQQRGRPALPAPGCLLAEAHTPASGEQPPVCPLPRRPAGQARAGQRPHTETFAMGQRWEPWEGCGDAGSLCVEERAAHSAEGAIGSPLI